MIDAAPDRGRRPNPSLLLFSIATLAIAAGAAHAQGSYGLTSRDGVDVWAVGDSGRYYRSLDGGSSWQSGTLGSRPLRAVATRNFRVVVVGDSGKIWKSENSGGAWALQVAAGTPSLRAVDLPADPIGFAAGDGGVILKTTDGGVTWNPQSSGTTNRLCALRFTSALDGWVAGEGGFLAHTVDGGAQWTPVAAGTTEDLYALGVRGSTVWVVGALATALKSVNGGAQWTSVPLRIDSRSDVRAVWVQSPDTVLLGGGGGFIRRSLDGGATWSFPIHAMHGQISGLHFAGGALFAASNRNRIVMRSLDVGATWSLPAGATLKRSWSPKLIPASVNVRGGTIALNHQNPHTLLCMLEGQVYRSTDEGETWQTQGVLIPDAVQTNAFIVSPRDSNAFLAATVFSTDPLRRIIKSTDGGQTWTDHLDHAFGEYGIPLEMHPDHPDTVFFGGEGDVLYRSIDFGTTWAPWGASTFRSPCDIVVVPDSAAIVQVADGTTGSGQGQIFRSTDGGVTWSLRWTNPFIGAGSEVPGLSCSRLRNGTTLATNWSTGGVERSTDFGSTWPVVANTNYSWGTDIAHDDPNVVMYGVFGGSRSFLSLDGGATFSNSDSTHLPNANYSLFLPDRGLMLAEQNNGLWKMDFTYAFTPGGAQGVTVTAPNGGESWAAGSVHSITWNAAAIALAHLEYRRSPADPWVAIADVEGYRGSYAWTIPANATTQAQVRVSDAWDAAPADLSNATFTITVTPALALLTPNGGETWPYGSQHAIRWTSVLVDSVALDLQATPGAAWTEIVPTFPAAGGSWTWTLPNLSTSVARVRVRQRGGALLDAGDGLFKITVPSWLASPDPIDFGPTLVGATNVTPIQLRNSGSGALTLTAVTSTNPDIHPGRTTLTIGPGAIDTLGIFYSPTAVGPDTSQVEITTNDPGSPHVIQVTGSGTTNTASGFGRPAVLALSPNHPNPFAGSTWIAYDLPVESDVALEVFDLHGHRVATLARGIEPAGQHRVRFGDPGDGTGERLAAGVYFVRLRVGTRSLTRKMLHVP